jgi:eukaryotic-like serine/threonine-protein kinase
MSFSAGTRLAQYEIVEPIGAGGMGEVYRGRDSRLGRDVALKVMAKHIAADPEMRRRFETEARAVASLSHPNIRSIHELAVVDDVPVAVMELLEGETLRVRLRRGAVTWREAVEIAASVADGLTAAHTRGIIHRDLKPENVFLTTDGAVKILDFGLALQRLDHPTLAADGPTMAATSQGVVLGTFGYMSPEQVTGGRVDARSDIFALGCVLYEMLAGRPLFTGATPQEVIAHLLHDSIPELEAFDPLAPAELRPILSRCIDRQPARRFESAHDVSMALRALLSGSAALSSAGARRRAPRSKSLAVLPFVNAGADPATEFLIDGITESIINSLSQLAGLRVVPRSLVFRYKGLQADPSTVGLALNARTILTGRVLQQGDYINIQAELVDTSTESQLWGEQFRQKIDELMVVQQEISWQISEALRLKLTGKQKTRLRKKPTVDPDAYQDYLRGRFYWNNWSPDGFKRARECFERAISRDPMYALAYAGLADTLGSMAYYGFIAPEDGFPRAKAAALRAIELDPDVPDAHASLALTHLFWDHDWPAAEREFKTAIKLNSQLAIPHALYSIFLISVGRFDEALEEGRLARRLDPLSLLTNMTVCWSLLFARGTEEVVREVQRVRELAPTYQDASIILLNAYEDLGRFEDAARVCAEYFTQNQPRDVARELIDAFHAGGPEAYWRKRLEILDSSTNAPALLDFAYAVVYSRLGDADRAIDHLERMWEVKSGGVVFIAVDPYLQRFRDHPRFKRLVARVGMPTASAPHTVST